MILRTISVEIGRLLLYRINRILAFSLCFQIRCYFFATQQKRNTKILFESTLNCFQEGFHYMIICIKHYIANYWIMYVSAFLNNCYLFLNVIL